MKVSRSNLLTARSATKSSVEDHFKKIGCFRKFKDEKIAVLQFGNLSDLGRAIALRFIEWAQTNPDGVCSLPTGKTPEYFIRWMNHLMEHWGEPDIASLIEKYGLVPQKPYFSNLTFVQIDDFFPMSDDHPNRFLNYIQQHYIKNFGFNVKRSLLMDFSALSWPKGLRFEDLFPDDTIDLTLRTRPPQRDLEELQVQGIMVLDSYAQEYEQRIREMGGLGFFLGGIGPDGHIAFNIKGSSFFSTTRLLHTNFETQAAAATDLGGIEISSRKAVMTIGLGTITFNPEVIAIIMAAGEAKAGVVSRAIIDSQTIANPASILQTLPNARMYLTSGASIKLGQRSFNKIKRLERITDDAVVTAVVSLSAKYAARVLDLTESQINDDSYCDHILKVRKWSSAQLKQFAYDELVRRLENGLRIEENKRFLHTGPHHDDIMLGILPQIIHQVRPANNSHDFAIMTSGFTSVQNSIMVDIAANLLQYLNHWEFKKRWSDGFFKLPMDELRNRNVKEYHESLIINNVNELSHSISRYIIRVILDIYNITKVEELRTAILELIDELAQQLPGAKDPKHIQLLKGSLREFEEDLVWSQYGFNSKDIHHLRLAFYTGDYFIENPTRGRDIPPISDLFNKVKPDILSLAFDPEGTGPDTHYKVMQAFSTYIEENHDTFDRPLEIWGYRNVWHRFHLGEANMYVPVSANSLATLDHTFKSCYITQKNASFPSYHHSGAFSELVQKIFVEQYSNLRVALGEEFWHDNENPRLRSAFGLLLMRKMDIPEFLAAAKSLRGLVGHT